MNPISSITFATDGKNVIARGNYELRIWDVATGAEITKLAKHHALWKVLSPDGKTMALSGEKNEIRLLDAETEKELRRLDANNTLILDFDFSHDGKLLASAGFGGIWIWNVATGKVVCRGVKGATSKKILFSPDGKLLAAQEERAVRLYETATGKVLPHPQPPFEGPLAFSPDSKSLAFVHSGQIRLWDVASGKELLMFQPTREDDPCYHFSMAFSPDGRTLATGGHHAVRFWETATGKELHKFRIHAYVAHALSFSPDGKKVASGGADRTVAIWDAATGKELHSFQGHQGNCSQATFSPDGQVLVSADNGSVHIWDVATGKGLRRLTGDPEPDYRAYLAFHRDGRTIAYKSWSAPLRLWQVDTGKALAQFNLGQLSQPPVMAFSRDGRMLATPMLEERSHPIELWDATTGKRIRGLEVKALGITALAMSPDGRILASGSQDSKVIIFDVGTGKELRRVTHEGSGVVYDLAFSPDGRRLASKAVNDGYRLWDTATGTELHLPITNPLGSPIVFSPDGNFLASGGRHWPARDAEVDTAVHLWELATGKQVRRFDGHKDLVESLAFSPDGRRLVSANRDMTGLVWDVTGRFQNGRLQPAQLSRMELEKLWADLAVTDAAKAYQGLWALAATPQQSVSFLAERVQPVPALDALHIRRLIADLDHDRYEVRERATEELKALEEQAVPALQKALALDPSAELRRRAKRVLDQRGNPITSPKKLQLLRTVTILEQVATPQARKLLALQASGDPAALVTVRAKAALERLDGPTAITP
jgi:WD40 repeat protein